MLTVVRAGLLMGIKKKKKKRIVKVVVVGGCDGKSGKNKTLFDTKHKMVRLH